MQLGAVGEEGCYKKGMPIDFSMIWEKAVITWQKENEGSKTDEVNASKIGLIILERGMLNKC